MKPWSREELSAAAACVQGSSSIKEALKHISEHVRPINDAHALANAFKRGGLASPSSMLRKSKSTPAGALTRILVIPDTHVPHEDEAALACALAVAREMRPDRLVFIGDFIDAESVSRHVRAPDRERMLKHEIAAGNAALDKFSALEIPQVDFCFGNHEFRIEAHVSEKTPELFGLVDLASLLRFKERGWNWLPYRQYMKIGKVGFAHDLGFAGKNATASSLASFGGSIVVGHSHRASVVYGGDVQGDRHVAVSSGWLGSIERAAGYMHRSAAERDWQHAVTWITMKSDGLAWCQLVPILNGECIVDGKLIRG